ncbi:MAG: hypothetical protein LBS43_10605 [Prevotellaceae bacterium]|jgi:hypothetical protein|nr:hypothetical protein [Prevotellaceae bacterium]
MAKSEQCRNNSQKCLYLCTLWQIGQTLDIRLVPLNEINKIPMPNMLFPDEESTLSPEASGEVSI